MRRVPLGVVARVVAVVARAAGAAGVVAVVVVAAAAVAPTVAPSRALAAALGPRLGAPAVLTRGLTLQHCQLLSKLQESSKNHNVGRGKMWCVDGDSDTLPPDC